MLACGRATAVSSRSGVGHSVPEQPAQLRPIAAVLHRRAKFITQTLAPLLTYDKEFSQIVEFKYVAWGNAHNTTAQVRLGSQRERCQRPPVRLTSSLAPLQPKPARHSVFGSAANPPCPPHATPCLLLSGRAVPARPQRVRAQSCDQLRHAPLPQPSHVAALCGLPGVGAAAPGTLHSGTTAPAEARHVPVCSACMIVGSRCRADQRVPAAPKIQAQLVWRCPSSPPPRSTRLLKPCRCRRCWRLWTSVPARRAWTRARCTSVPRGSRAMSWSGRRRSRPTRCARPTPMCPGAAGEAMYMAELGWSSGWLVLYGSNDIWWGCIS